ETDGFGLSATDGGLRPAPPSSVEPSGIPTVPTDPGPMDEAIGGDAGATHVAGALARMIGSIIDVPINMNTCVDGDDAICQMVRLHSCRACARCAWRCQGPWPQTGVTTDRPPPRAGHNACLGSASLGSTDAAADGFSRFQ